MRAQGDGRPVAVIGAGLDLGAGRRGVDMGPSATRYAGFASRIEQLGRRCEDWGNVETAVAEASAVGDERVRLLSQIKETCGRVAGLVAKAVEGGFLPLTLGGDHSVALGTLGGLARAAGPGGVLWLDAHADLNRPETSPSGNVHGMPLAAALGLAGPGFESPDYRLPALERDRVALVGIRSLDPAEPEALAELRAPVHDERRRSDRGRAGVTRVAGAGCGAGFAMSASIWTSSTQRSRPASAPPCAAGSPTARHSWRCEAHLAMELVAESELAGSLEVVEVNLILDRENETAKLAIELVASALGRASCNTLVTLP